MKRPTDSTRSIRSVIRLVLAVCLGVGLLLAVTGATRSGTAGAASGTVEYSATAKIPTPLPAKFSGSSGGDGWAVAVSSTQIFNVFHHQTPLQVACHYQASAKQCWNPKTITDANGHEFATSYEPGLYLNRKDGHLYVFAVRTSDSTAGVVCIDTSKPAADSGRQLFCGFTRLSAVGGSPYSVTGGGGDSSTVATASGAQAPEDVIVGLSAPALVGSDWYSFNEVKGTGTGTENKLLCFDVVTAHACADQPFALADGGQALAAFTGASPAAAIGSDVMVQVVGTSRHELACFDAATQSNCAGSWPVTVADAEGAPFPLLSTTGALLGTCLPIAGNPCYSLSGTAVATPPNMAALIGGTKYSNGPALVMGTRVYLANRTTDQVDCYNYATSASCPNFPKSFQNLFQIYTVNPDPGRPDCIWVNSDHGSGQIQDFDAITGGTCPPGPVRVQAASVVRPYKKCLPTRWISLQVKIPSRNSYGTATVRFENSSGAPLAGIPAVTVNGAGAVDLTSLGLAHRNPLPQFVITFSGETAFPARASVELTWAGSRSKICVPTTSTASTRKPPTGGYWLDASDGGIFAFGNAGFYGSTGNITLNKPVVGMAATKGGRGYWLDASDGGIFAFGNAGFYGSTGNIILNKPAVGMAATPDGKGYWLVASDGGLFAFGDARFYGSTGNITLNQPVVGMAATPDGKGYWLVASDGGIFSFGDARFYGSTGNIALNKPIVGMATTPDGKGYWLVASDGGIFAFGDAAFYGSTGSITLNKPVVGMAATPSGKGYWLVASDGGIFAFGDAAFHGSTGNITLNKPVVGMAP
jgi:hypothetical protein